jgi:general secretion pathway protein E
MTTRPSGRAFVAPRTVLTVLVLALVVGVADVALAQAQPAAAGAAAQPAPQAEAAAAGFYLNLWWLGVIAVTVCAWFYATSWMANDARGVGVNVGLVTCLMLAGGGVGLLFTLVLHPAFVFLMAILVVSGFFVYVGQRNKVVPERHKLFGAHHRAELWGKVPGLGKVAALKPRLRAPAVSVPLNNAEGRLLHDLVEEQPSLREAADFLSDVILRAGATRSSRASLVPGEGQYTTQFLMDGVPANVEGVAPELSQQILGCVSQFAGLVKGGRIRPGSSRIHAELPGQGRTEIGVQVTAPGGRPMLMLTFPDWTVDLYKSGLEALGVHEAVARRLKVALGQKNSAIVFCGGPGTGKTTTLYATLGIVDIFTTDVVALEKREEHELHHMRRWLIPDDQPFDGFFDAILREGPDAIMFGEIEAPEHAQRLLRFAVDTGQVLTTMKSQDAPDCLVRLAKFSGKPSLVMDTVSCLVGQRLVRRLCTDCREEVEPNPELLKRLDISLAEPGKWYRPVGCEACLNSGYRGRIGVFSMLILTDPVKEVLSSADVTAVGVSRAAGGTAFRTMYQDGISKVAAGVTTLDEVRRVLRGGRPAEPEKEQK